MGRRRHDRARVRHIQESSEVTVRFRSSRTDRNRFGLRPKENNPGSCRNIHLHCVTLFPTILDGASLTSNGRRMRVTYTRRHQQLEGDPITPAEQARQGDLFRSMRRGPPLLLQTHETR